MNLIAVVDDRNGMMFNKRRQSVWKRVNHIKKIFKDNIKNFLSQPYN